jgi:hypothetical protein
MGLKAIPGKSERDDATLCSQVYTYSTQNSDPTYRGHQSAKPSRPRLRPGQRPPPNASTRPSITADNERFCQRKPGRDCKRNVA